MSLGGPRPHSKTHLTNVLRSSCENRPSEIKLQNVLFELYYCTEKITISAMTKYVLRDKEIQFGPGYKYFKYIFIAYLKLKSILGKYQKL